MVFWKQLRNKTAGFTLIEVLVAITILGLVVVPIGSSLVVSYRLNARSGDTLQAQLAVSRAVETIMAEGFDPEADYEDQFSDVLVEHYCGYCLCDTDGCDAPGCTKSTPCDKCTNRGCCGDDVCTSNAGDCIPCAPCGECINKGYRAIKAHVFKVTAKNMNTAAPNDLLGKITVTTYARPYGGD